MPDTRLTWSRFREHLRKYGWIYLVGIAVCLVCTNLLWTTTAPRVPDDQAVVIFLADGYSNPKPLADVAEAILKRSQEYDNTLEEVEFQSLMYADPSVDYTGPMVLMARLSTGEGDAFLASQVVMDSLVNSEVLLHLDEPVKSGWMADYGLEPYYVTVTDEETGEQDTYLAGLKIDKLAALSKAQAFNNEGAYLAVTSNGTNQETTLRALEVMVDELLNWKDE